MKRDAPDALDQIHALQRSGRSVEEDRQLTELQVGHLYESQLHRAKAVVEQQAGRLVAAVASMRQAVGLACEVAIFHLELGQLLAQTGDVAGACDAFGRAVALQPDLVEGWLLWGMTLYGARRDTEALPVLRRGYAVAPGRPDMVRALAEVEYALGHHVQALPLFEWLAGESVLDPQLALHLGRCHSRMGCPEQALRLWRQVLQGGVQSAELWAALGHAEEELGNAAVACTAYHRAHALRPDWADPIGALLMLQRDQATPALVDTATALLGSDHLADVERAFLHFALGKVMDARGEYAGAMTHWRHANRWQRQQTGPLDRVALRQRVEDAVSTFTPDLFASMRLQGSTDERPVFIVGMPRSGTTLAEQIIATHPKARGAGELTELVRIASTLPNQDFRWPRDAARLSSETLHRLAQGYLDVAVRRAGADATRIVDKQPYNFFHVGLASLLFPRARVIWCRRDPRDISLSIYGENFAVDAAYATDFADIARVIEAHDALMRHWQRVSPLPILEVEYERLVTQMESQSRRLIEFVGLPWDEACLQFHANTRAVQTPSRWQVRQPMHSRSVGRWRHYAAWMPTVGDDVL